MLNDHNIIKPGKKPRLINAKILHKASDGKFFFKAGRNCCLIVSTGFPIPVFNCLVMDFVILQTNYEYQRNRPKYSAGRLEMSELRISAENILDGLSEGVYVCDRRRRIVYWSKASERITGWQSADVIGRACHEDILCHEDKDGHRLCGKEYCPLHRSMVTGVTSTTPIIVFARGKDGRRIPMQVTTAPLYDDSGEVIGGIESFRDVSPMLVDLERAKRIQTRSLQHELPEDPRVRFVTFYMAHDIVGGDYYAVQPLDDDRYAFFLADMEGHGVAAALYTMHLGMLWQRHHALLDNPAEFAAKINKELVRVFGDINTFAAATCGFIDARDASLCFAGAGGPPPLIVDARGNFKKLPSSGLPFGFTVDIPESAAYQAQTVPLAAGDAILMFSDGAFEIHNAKDDLLGVDGFIRILKDLNYPREPLNMTTLEEALLKFSNDIRLQDDITIIEARFLP
jgi:PAS domain S-box-containing protein